MDNLVIFFYKHGPIEINGFCLVNIHDKYCISAHDSYEILPWRHIYRKVHENVMSKCSDGLQGGWQCPDLLWDSPSLLSSGYWGLFPQE
jgi:hypothetical protein